MPACPVVVEPASSCPRPCPFAFRCSFSIRNINHHLVHVDPLRCCCCGNSIRSDPGAFTLHVFATTRLVSHDLVILFSGGRSLLWFSSQDLAQILLFTCPPFCTPPSHSQRPNTEQASQELARATKKQATDVHGLGRDRHIIIIRTRHNCSERA